MTRLLAQRALSLVFVLLALTFVTFGVSSLAPGDPILNLMGARQDPVRYAALKHVYGLDRPWLAQYADYLAGLLRGDLGLSYKYAERPVADLIGTGLPVSLLVGGLALAVSVAVGVPVGVYAALKQNTWVDTALMALMLTLYSIPSFVLIPLIWIGVLALYRAGLPTLPVAGWGRPEHLVLPVLVLSAGNLGYLARLTRGSVLDVLRLDYVRTARAKGLTESRVLWRHVLRNALLPLITVLGPAAAFLVTGAFVVENLFALPGLGFLAVQSIGQRDYPVIQATTILLGAAVVAMNLLADLAYLVADPRVRAE
ncbi:MAG: ABC transporter permease [Anaerolineales bacterium]|nr:ABC transporter permease [Anaerolineales bacterium]